MFSFFEFRSNLKRNQKSWTLIDYQPIDGLMIGTTNSFPHWFASIQFSENPLNQRSGELGRYSDLLRGVNLKGEVHICQSVKISIWFLTNVF